MRGWCRSGVGYSVWLCISWLSSRTAVARLQEMLRVAQHDVWGGAWCHWYVAEALRDFAPRACRLCAPPRSMGARKRIASRPGRTRRGNPCATPPPAPLRLLPARRPGGRPASVPPRPRACPCARHSLRSGHVRRCRRCSTWPRDGRRRGLSGIASGAGRCLFKQVKLNVLLI